MIWEPVHWWHHCSRKLFIYFQYTSNALQSGKIANINALMLYYFSFIYILLYIDRFLTCACMIYMFIIFIYLYTTLFNPTVLTPLCNTMSHICLFCSLFRTFYNSYQNSWRNSYWAKHVMKSNFFWSHALEGLEYWDICIIFLWWCLVYSEMCFLKKIFNKM